MRDPLVRGLRYSLEYGEEVWYRDPPPVEFLTDVFAATLADGVLEVAMLKDYTEVTQARADVEPYLRAWELHDALKGPRDGIRFVYKEADVVDRDPPPPGSGRGVLDAAGSMAGLGDSVVARVGRRRYPDPPQAFRVTPDVETMWLRYEGYRKGKEPLLAMVYACLTLIEASAAGRKQAAKYYRVEYEVLGTIGELTSTRGDGTTARKFHRGGPNLPLTHREERWLDAAVRQLMARVAEIEGGSTVDQLTFAHLPEL